MPDYQKILQELYPEGSIQGQCGVFAHRLMVFATVGNTLQSKTLAVERFGYTAAQLQGGYDAGDVIITKESLVYGHVAFINAILDPVKKIARLTESNFNLDLRVHHGRVINLLSPELVGCIRGPLIFLPKTNGQQ